MDDPMTYDETTTDAPIARETFARSVAAAVDADFDDVIARWGQHKAAAHGLKRVAGDPACYLSCPGQETARAVDAVRDVHGDSWFRHFGRFYADDLKALAVELEANHGFTDAPEILAVWAATFAWPFTAEDAWIDHTGAERTDMRTDIKEGVDAVHGTATADVKPHTDRRRAYANGYIKADFLVCYAETGDGRFAFGVESSDKSSGHDGAYIKARDLAE